MIKFFSKIRQSLINENKLGKYLLYAVGEIILVVIGILIALAINSNQQYKISREIEYKNLVKYSSDLLQDSIHLQDLISREEKINQAIDSLYLQMLEEEKTNVALIFQKVQIVGYSSIFTANTGTFDEAVATGSMQTLLNDSLRSAIFSYYKIVKSNINDNITDRYQTNEIVPVLLDIVGSSREAVQFLMNVENPYLESLNIKSLLKNPEFNKILIWRKANCDILIGNWKHYLDLNSELRSKINSELKIKKQGP